MKKKYYIALIKTIRINHNEYIVHQKVSLSFDSDYFDTLQEAEKFLREKGSRFVEYTILTEYYNND